MRSRLWSRAVLGGALATLGLGVGVAAPAAAQSPSYSGDAQVVGINASLLGIPLPPIEISKTGPLPASGGVLSETLLTIPPTSVAGIGVQATVAQAVTMGSGGEASSHAHVADADVTTPVVAVGATVLQANSKAACNSAGGADLSGSSSIADLRINDATISVSGQPNQEIKIVDVAGLEVATIIINEQTRSTYAGGGSITVNALHVIVNGSNSVLNPIASADIVISHAHSDVSDCPPPPPPPPPGCGKKNQPPCPPPPPPPACTVKDFITGGGWVIRNGERVSFAVHGGVNADGTLRNGGLNIVDHGDGGHRSSHTLTGYRITGATTRELDFDIGTVKVADNGEPGTSDTWQFSGDGYSAGSTSSPIGAGNIQLHQPKGCPSDPPKGGGKGGGKPR